MTARRTETLGTLAAVLCGAAWGSLNIVTKLAFRSGLNVGTLISIRTMLSALLLWALSYGFRCAHRITRGQALRLVLLGLILYALQSFLFNQALSRVPASIAVFGLYTYPSMVALLALILGRERVRPATVAALLLGLVGIGLVLSVSTEGIAALGVLFALASAGVWTVFVIASHRVAQEVNPLVFTSFLFTGASVSLFAGAAAVGTLQAPTAHQWGWLFLSAVIPPVAVGALAVAMSLMPPTRASIGNTFDPPTTATLGALVLGEHLTPPQILGAGLVIAALAIPAVAERTSIAVPAAALQPAGTEFGDALAGAETHV